jgi:uracil-DNA glycosylase
MFIDLKHNWQSLLQEDLESEYFQNTMQFVNQEYVNQIIYPPQNLIFNAFKQCDFDKLKVVIIGQDPYHGVGQANGLSFSVNEGIKHPPSLKNIFKEVNSDLGKEIPLSGNLERWANQGVLLLNATLTVRAAFPGSHQNKGWEVFTDAVIRKVSEKKEHLVFLLWGTFAQKKEPLIDSHKHLILESAHPSPLSAYRGFFGNKHFSKTNMYLKQHGYSEIDW